MPSDLFGMSFHSLIFIVYALYYHSFAGKCFLAGMLLIASPLEMTGHIFLVKSLTTITVFSQPHKPSTNGIILAG